MCLFVVCSSSGFDIDLVCQKVQSDKAPYYTYIANRLLTMGRDSLRPRRGGTGRPSSPLGITLVVILLLLGPGERPTVCVGAAQQAESLDIEQVRSGSRTI